MKPILCTFTQELLSVMDKAMTDKTFTSRNAAIEHWIWSCSEIKRAAKQTGIKRKPRPTRGRPKRVFK